MPLPVPQLDNRSAQDIVDEAKGLISKYCPEWTDHNVSDPGVALIELFAWMTELLLYRANQVPEKLYIKFLELLGLTLTPPAAAQAPVTFYLSAAQPDDVEIRAGTEVATVRTEVSDAILFTTKDATSILVPRLLGAYTRAANAGRDAPWLMHDLRLLTVSETRAFPVWPARPAPPNWPGNRGPAAEERPLPGDAFYLALERDASNHVIALALECPSAGGTGVQPDNPPFIWEAWQGLPNRWAECVVERDGTRAFNREQGEIFLRLPEMASGEFQGLQGYWLRCRLTEAQQGSNGYLRTPSIRKLSVEARGVTVAAEHATVTYQELIGQSEGVPGQRFQLRYTPILARDPATDYVEVLPRRAVAGNGSTERWEEVPDFGGSRPQDRHYTLDTRDGTLCFGPVVAQPDGQSKGFGAVPEKGATIRFTRYRHGGGIDGNVPAGALAVLKSAIPYVYQVVNWEPASGGRDQQSIEAAKLLAPYRLRTGERAVTADDFEFYARMVPGVARARCLAPGAQPAADPNLPRPGYVSIVVLPQVPERERPLTADHLRVSTELRVRVREALDRRRVVGISLDIQPPQYVWVSVQAAVRADPRLPAEAVRQRAEAALGRYLDPFLGGPDGEGWPFGREVRPTELYAVLQRAEGVEVVENVQLSVLETARDGSAWRRVDGHLPLAPHAVICSVQHQVVITNLSGAERA